MSQHDLTINNQGFPAFRADLNDALQALGSTQSGTTAPSPTFANQLWYDTTNNILKIRNEDNDAWISLLTLDQSADSVSSISTATAVLSAGTVSLPAITTTGDTNTGIYFPAADTIAFTEGGVEAMRIDSSGNVGIGLTAPTRLLHIDGGSSTTYFQMTNTASGRTNADGFQIAQDGANAELINREAGYLNFATSNTERMRIISTGDVGIGTSSPVVKLHVVRSDPTSILAESSGNTASYLGLKSTSGEAYIGTTSNGIVFNTSSGATERMRIDSSGNVLVGATSAVNSSKFLIAGVSGSSPVIQGASSAGAYLHFYNNAQTTGGLQIGQGNSSGSDNVGILLNNANEPIVIGTNGTERMRIDSSGNLLVGKTSQTNTGKLEIDYSRATHAGTSYNETSASSTCTHIAFQRGGAGVGSISSPNNSSTAYNTSSDYRLKENIAPMIGALDKVAQLKPCTYTWKSDGSDGQGFIAHELQKIAPYAVTGEKDGEQMQGVDYGKITPLLTAALQEALAKIESLEARLAALESK
jgi:hypothetical protein